MLTEKHARRIRRSSRHTLLILWFRLARSSGNGDLQHQVAVLQERVRHLEQQLQLERNGSLAVDATGTALLQKRFLHRVDSAGHFAIPSRLTRFSLDVGFNVGKIMLGDWLSQSNAREHFMIGIEANPYLYTVFDTMTTARRYPKGYEGMYWTPNNNSGTTERARTFRSHSDQLMLIHAAAVSSLRGVADFHLGVGWHAGKVESDVGSLYGWDNKQKSKASEEDSESTVTVATIRLDEILARVPPPPRLRWDTLKIDIQGADTDALIGAGDYMKHFMCVVGEFSSEHYKVPSGVTVSPRSLLSGLGFRLALASNHPKLQVWVNMRYRSVFEECESSKRCDFTCSAHTAGQRDGISKMLLAKKVKAMPMDEASTTT